MKYSRLYFWDIHFLNDFASSLHFTKNQKCQMIGMIVFKRKHVSSFDTMQFIKFCKQENINGIINCIQTRKKVSKKMTSWHLISFLSWSQMKIFIACESNLQHSWCCASQSKGKRRKSVALQIVLSTEGYTVMWIIFGRISGALQA